MHQPPPLLPVQVKQLGYAINGTALIKSLDLTLTAGPRTVIMGANGAGQELAVATPARSPQTNVRDYSVGKYGE